MHHFDFCRNITGAMDLGIAPVMLHTTYFFYSRLFSARQSIIVPELFYQPTYA